MTFMSIDASTKSTGVAIFNGYNLIEYNLITASSTNLIKRIKIITSGILELIKKYPEITFIVIEEVRPQNGTANIKTQRALMFLQAAINFMLYDNFPKIELIYMYPSEWRKYCKIKQGAGVQREQLKKEDIEWAKKQYNVDVNDDVADAIGIGYGYLKQQEAPKELNWD